MVKSNAYGLGAVPISKALEKAGADRFGVTCANEGIELRESGIRKPILILTGFWPGEEKRLIENRLTPAVTRIDDVRHLEKRRQSLARPSGRWRFHLKINTGMNRLGILPSELDAFAAAFADCRHLELEGTFTHFASAEDFSAQPDRSIRSRCFGKCSGKMRALGISPGIVHMANSGAICARPSTWADMVRPGAIIYGYYQSFDPPEKSLEVQRRLPVEPSLSLRARIITLRDLPAGQPVGYSARFVTERPSRIAVINAGYADGILRQRTNRGCALVHGRRVPLVGAISMDLTTLDVTDVPGRGPGRRRHASTAAMAKPKSACRTWPAKSARSLPICCAPSASASRVTTSDCFLPLIADLRYRRESDRRHARFAALTGAILRES